MEFSTVRKLDELMKREPLHWFDMLEPVASLPVPFSNPFPYYVCGQCSAIGEVVCHVLMHDAVEFCQVAIARLEIALDFYRNNGGRSEPGYKELSRALRQQKDDLWRQMPFAVRAKISQWFTLADEESFLGYYPDEDFSRSETGTAGIILTNRRMVYKKYASHREYPLGKGGKMFIESNRAAAMIEISQHGERDAMLTVKPTAATALARALSEQSEPWEIKVQSSQA